jgi:SAM-dependent methyltransferase
MDAALAGLVDYPDRDRLLAEVAAAGAGDDARLATLTSLRRRYDAELVAAAVGQVRLRERAAGRLGPAAARMFFTPAGLEQATRATVAAHRARRYAAAGVDRVLDLCCGLGGDLTALAAAGLSVTGVDADPITVALTRANIAALGLTAVADVQVGDATAYPSAGWPAAFCDPARRHGSRRVFDPADYSPPYSFLIELAAAVPHTSAKVAPGLAHDLVPLGAEAEWVSDHGDVCEAALWFGPFATASVSRRATLLPGGDSLVEAGLGPPPVAAPGRWLYEPDGAVIRAHLVAEVAAEVDGWLLDPTIAYVSADRLVPTPYARSYEVTDVLAFSLKRLRTLLRERGVGTVTVKKRGSAVLPEQLRRDLRLTGDASATVVLTRVQGAPTVLVCQPVVP